MAAGTDQQESPFVERLQRDLGRRQFEMDFIKAIAEARSKKRTNPQTLGFLDATIGPQSIQDGFAGIQQSTGPPEPFMGGSEPMLGMLAQLRARGQPGGIPMPMMGAGGAGGGGGQGGQGAGALQQMLQRRQQPTVGDFPAGFGGGFSGIA